MRRFVLNCVLGVTALVGLVSASASAEEIISLTGPATESSASLHFEAMKDIFETRVTPKTCFKRVQTGTERVCEIRNVYGYYPRSRYICVTENNVQNCRWITEHVWEYRPQRLCELVPTYFDVAYDCSITEKVKIGEELDIRVNSQVKVQVASTLGLLNRPINLRLSAHRSDISLSMVERRKDVLLLGKLLKNSESAQGKEVQRGYGLQIEMLSTAEVMKPIEGAIDLEVGSRAGRLIIRHEGAMRSDLLEITLSVIKPKEQGEPFSKVLFSKKLLSNQMEVISSDANGTVIEVDLNALPLNQPLTSGEYEVSALLRVPAESLSKDAGVINPEAMERVRAKSVRERLSF